MTVEQKPKKRRMNINVQMALFVGGIIGTGIWYLRHPSVPFTHPHIKAPPYVWPAGCLPADYGRSDNTHYTPAACADINYLFDHNRARSFGLPHNDKNEHYYRVNNKLLNLDCYYSRSAGMKLCLVANEFSESFYQK